MKIGNRVQFDALNIFRPKIKQNGRQIQDGGHIQDGRRESIKRSISSDSFIGKI